MIKREFDTHLEQFLKEKSPGVIVSSKLKHITDFCWLAFMLNVVLHFLIFYLTIESGFHLIPNKEDVRKIVYELLPSFFTVSGIILALYGAVFTFVESTLATRRDSRRQHTLDLINQLDLDCNFWKGASIILNMCPHSPPNDRQDALLAMYLSNKKEDKEATKKCLEYLSRLNGCWRGCIVGFITQKLSFNEKGYSSKRSLCRVKKS